MTDVIGVGIVELDIKINQKYLKMEFDKLGSTVNNNFKNMFNEIVNQSNSLVTKPIERKNDDPKEDVSSDNKNDKVDKKTKKTSSKLKPFIYSPISKGVKAAMNHTKEALKTNEEFVDSLNKIKTNLMVAFQPVYDFILPAINSLMKYLTTVTTYIASTISSLFGKTYQQSYDAAKDMKSNELGKFEMTMPDLDTADMGGLDNFIKDISNPFTLLLGDEGTGNVMIQGIYDILQSMVDVVERIGTSLNTVWDEVGSSVIQAFLDILRTTLETLDNLGEKLVWVWDHGGQHMFEGFLELGAKIFELAEYIYTEFVMPFVDWFVDLISPAIAEVMDWIGKLLDEFTEFIDWLLGDGKPVLDTIVAVLGSIAAAFGIAATISSVFGAAMAFITSPIGIVALAIGAVITVGVLLCNHWDEISVWIKDLWQGIKDKAKEIWSGIAQFFEKLWEGITTVLTEAWNSIVEFLVKLWNGLSENVTEIWDGIKGFISDTWDTIKTKTSEIWNTIKTFLTDTIWDPIKETALNIWESIKGAIINPIKVVQENLTEVWSRIKEYIIGKWNEISQGIVDMKDKLINGIMNPFQIAGEKISDVIGNAKNWGTNLIQNFIDGINAMIGKVKDAVSKVADTVKDFLGFSSPTKKGPGSKADKWMPNFMEMMADGIEDNIYEVSAAVNTTANTLKGVQPNTDDMASAVGTAVMVAMQQGNVIDSGDDREIILELDGARIGKVLLPRLNEEVKRRGFKEILEV